MKRIKEFKNYRTTTEYDEATGKFTDQRIEHEGFEDQDANAAAEKPPIVMEDRKYEAFHDLAIAAE